LIDQPIKKSEMEMTQTGHAEMEPMTSYNFLAGISGIDEAGWRAVESAARETTAHLEEWDSAWNLVVALGLAGEAHPAMAAAREAGAGLRVQALAGAACAAVAARGQIGERRFRSLYRPFAEVLPAEPEEPPASLVSRLAAHCPLTAAWR
jgi:hypothetical protein